MGKLIFKCKIEPCTELTRSVHLEILVAGEKFITDAELMQENISNFVRNQILEAMKNFGDAGDAISMEVSDAEG